MPVLEAMACGTPVITSKASSMEEIAGDAAVLVDALSVESIKNGLVDLCTKEELRRELSAKGMENVKKYTWETAGDRLMQVYQDLMKE